MKCQIHGIEMEWMDEVHGVDIWYCDDCHAEEEHEFQRVTEIDVSEWEIPVGAPCPHCQSTLTDDVATIWEDEYLRCDAHTCYRCGETFETVTPKEAVGPDAELDKLEGEP